MPKVSEEHLAARRAEILEGARRAFAKHGYEGATVARLEEESGLSRGAIFNYFGSKEDIFVALVERDQERISKIWAGEAYAAALRSISAEDPAWLGVYIEPTRRMRTAPDFARRRREAGASVRGVVEEWLERARERGELRSDLPAETVGTFLGIVIDGLAVRAAAGLELPDLDDVLRLVADATAGPARLAAQSRS